MFLKGIQTMSNQLGAFRIGVASPVWVAINGRLALHGDS